MVEMSIYTIMQFYSILLKKKVYFISQSYLYVDFIKTKNRG